jgi:hypothetical protein
MPIVGVVNGYYPVPSKHLQNEELSATTALKGMPRNLFSPIRKVKPPICWRNIFSITGVNTGNYERLSLMLPYGIGEVFLIKDSQPNDCPKRN